MSERFTKSVVEDAALAWLGKLGFAVLHRPEIASGELAAERTGLHGVGGLIARALTRETSLLL